MSNLNQPMVCPVEGAGILDSNIRRWFQNPAKIIAPYIEPNMKVIDFGCGPGFFTIEIARNLSDKGKVFAVDLQQGMLNKLSEKIKNAPFANRIALHKCEQKKLGLTEKVDFILAFYVVHEVPDPDRLLSEFKLLLNPGGSLLIVEPKGHVNKNKFDATVNLLKQTGFSVSETHKVFFSRSILAKV
jgi:ubiquinone/menaquinone biosynthesis C-methylase UbiE